MKKNLPAQRLSWRERLAISWKELSPAAKIETIEGRPKTDEWAMRWTMAWQNVAPGLRTEDIVSELMKLERAVFCILDKRSTIILWARIGILYAELNRRTEAMVINASDLSGNGGEK